MPLFSTLLPQPKGEDEAASLNGAKSLDLPTVVQLFADQPLPLHLDTAQVHNNLSIVSPENHVPPPYAALHYTAVSCQTTAQVMASQEQQRGLRQQGKKSNTLVSPDLGVWNFRVSSSDSLVSMIASTSSASALKTFCMVIDLSVVENVEPAITKIQSALVRFLISQEPKKENVQKQDAPNTCQTTSLYQLRKVQFGLGPKDENSTKAMTNTEPDPSDLEVCIALQICAKLPANASDFQNYRDQQALALIVYHLRRYTAALSASLLFVSGISSTQRSKNTDGTAADLGLSPSKSNDSMDSPSFALLQEQPSVPVTLLPLVWRELALGKAVWKPEECADIYEDMAITKYTESTKSPENEESDVVTAHHLIYGPGEHNEDLIESVLLRNAHYPGHWDAAKDSIWKILPKDDSVQNDSSSRNKVGANTKKGDEWWLTELRESIAIPDAVKTPPPKKSAENAGSVTKTPNDAAVSSFFEDLLK